MVVLGESCKKNYSKQRKMSLAFALDRNCHVLFQRIVRCNNNNGLSSIIYSPFRDNAYPRIPFVEIPNLPINIKKKSDRALVYFVGTPAAAV